MTSTRRSTAGTETRRRLLDWEKTPAASERLAVLILGTEGYKSIDPTHPSGGPDNLRDAICIKDDVKWVVSVFFPHGTKPFSEIKRKFQRDVEGITKNETEGIVFVTNQKLTLAKRRELESLVNGAKTEIYHLERVASILDSPPCLGMRLDFLEIEMTKEEQLSFVSLMATALDEFQVRLQTILNVISDTQSGSLAQPKVDPQEPFYVSPSFSSSYFTGSLYQNNLHRCSNCDFGYFVKQDPYGIYVGTGLASIACPKCGNVETYLGRL